MDLKVQKRLAAQVMKCSPKRVVFDNDNLEEIKKSITNRDIKLLIGAGVITKIPARGVSRVRARKIKVQKSKGRRKGPGSKKGKHDARYQSKMVWMNNIRVQRAFLSLLLSKNLIDKKAYRMLYLKCKGGYFRSRRHIKLYLDEKDLILKNGNVPKETLAEKPAEKKKRLKME